MSMDGKNHYNTVISLQLIKINEKKKKERMVRWSGEKQVDFKSISIPLEAS